MIEVIRIVENQANLSSYRATQNEEHAAQLEYLIELTKPKNLYLQWHPLIATPFRYNPPHPQARFRPPFGKNVFYASLIEETALYEHAYHFMRQRLHLNVEPETGTRTLFFVDVNDEKFIHLNMHEDVALMMDKNDYSKSHQFIKANPEATLIIYPSCRDPKKRDNAAILSIECLAKNPKWETAIKFFYSNSDKKILWIDYKLHINWDEVN